MGIIDRIRQRIRISYPFRDTEWGDGGSDEDDEKEEPEDDDPPDLRWPPCREATWDKDADQTIEVGIYYHKGYEYEAQVVRSYTEYALADAFGDRYAIDVEVVQSVSRDLNEFVEWCEWLKRDDTPSKQHANHLLGETGDVLGGYWGIDCSIGNANDLGKLEPDCVLRKGWGDEHEAVNIAIHEIGHSLGMKHKKSGKYLDGATHPMSTTYIDSTHFDHRYHPDSVSESHFGAK